MTNVSYCQACHRPAAVKYCEYTQGIGLIVLRTTRRVKGNLCRHCASKYFWEYTGLTLLTGWWGIISFIMNIVFIISNFANFIASRSLADPGTAGFPIQPSRQPSPLGQNVEVPPVVAQIRTDSSPLAGFRNDIVLRLRGSESSRQIAEFIAPRAGVSVAVAEQYVLAVAQGRA